MSDTGKTIALIKALAPAPEIDPEQVKQDVEDWLDDHPEATTTVQDGSVTRAKLAAGLEGDLAAVESGVTELDKKTDALGSGIISLTNEKKEMWYTGVYNETFTSSTFSGFATSWTNTAAKLMKGLSFNVRSRADTNITKIAVRIESDDGTLAIEKVFDVDVGATKQTVTVPLFCSLPAGLIWVGIAANKIATFDHSSVTAGAYEYWTNGDLTHLSNLKRSGGVTKRLAITVLYFDAVNIDNGSIPQGKLSFAELVEPENLVDITNENQCKPGWWYYSTTVGSVIAPSELESQYNYTAVTAKVYDAEKITIDFLPHRANMSNQPNIYWVGAADADMKLLAYSIVNTTAPVTYTLPEGAVYFLASPGIKDAKNLGKMMVVKGEAATKYIEGKGEKYLLDGCMIDADNIDTKINTGLKLPDNYDLVVGDTFQLFKKGIVNAANPDVYDVRFECAKGSNYTRFFEITPTTAETLELTVYLYDADHNLIDNKTVTLTVRAKKTSPASNVNVLCVGDSLTTGGVWPYELKRRLTGSGGTPEGDGLSNITFIGTRQANETNYEGYGGWTFTQYNTANVSSNVKIITCSHDKTEADDQHSVYKDGLNLQWKLETIGSGQIKIIAINNEGRDFPATGTLTWVSGGTHHSDIVYTASENAEGNPFWDSTQEKVDFSTYAARIGASGIDYVLVLMGWNSAADNETDYKAKAQTFIDNVQASYPNAKIVLMGLEVPARDGLGVNYGASDMYANYYRLMQFVFNLDKWYQDLADENENVYHFNLAGQFDTENNMMTETRQVNTRNPATETIQSNGVHPATPGYLQIADAMYRAIEGLM